MRAAISIARFHQDRDKSPADAGLFVFYGVSTKIEADAPILISRYDQAASGIESRNLPTMSNDGIGRMGKEIVNKKARWYAGLWMIKWWRRRESNPRPQILRLRFYMLIPSIDLTNCYPKGREDNWRVRKSFNESTPDRLHRDLARVDA